MLGLQKEMDLQVFEVPENLIVRRWIAEGGVEFIRQELQQTRDVSLTGLKTVTLSYQDILADEVEVTFQVAETGQLTVKYGPDKSHYMDTGIRLR